MTYDLCRHGLIQRTLNNHGSQVPDWGSALAYASSRCTVASCIGACPNRSTAVQAPNRTFTITMRRLGLACAGLFNKAISESGKIGNTSVTWDLPRDAKEMLIKALLGFNQRFLSWPGIAQHFQALKRLKMEHFASRASRSES